MAVRTRKEREMGRSSSAGQGALRNGCAPAAHRRIKPARGDSHLVVTLRFAHLCDYAMSEKGSKPVIVGIWDVVFDNMKVRPIPLPPIGFFFARLECSLADGDLHRVRVVIRHEDGHPVHEVSFGELKFLPTGPGRPLRAQLLISIGGMPFPDLGEYSFELWVDDAGAPLGEATITIVDAPVRPS